MAAGLGGNRPATAATALPVIVATARGDSADVVEAVRQGASDYLVKPFDFAAALARVETQPPLKESVDAAEKTPR